MHHRAEARRKKCRKKRLTGSGAGGYEAFIGRAAQNRREPDMRYALQFLRDEKGTPCESGTDPPL